MAPKRSTCCARCGHPKSDTNAFHRKGSFADGNPRFFPICKKCAAVDSARPEKREKAKERKSTRRRKAGIPERARGAAKYCPKGHLKAENLRPGRYDCTVCHREAQLNRNRAAGAKPMGKIGDNWKCGHDPTSSLRFVKGKPQGCKHCHREKERNRPFDYERWRRYYDANRDALRKYVQAWQAVNRPGREEYKKVGAARDYVSMIMNDPCVYCGFPSEAVDHIVAVSRGGSGCVQNLAPVCKSCNSSKQTKDVLNFMLYRLAKSDLLDSRSQ